jgi:hypothetical protein
MLRHHKAECTDKQLSVLEKPPMRLVRPTKTALAEGLFGGAQKWPKKAQKLLFWLFYTISPKRMRLMIWVWAYVKV